MVKLTKSNGEAVSFSVKGAGRKVKGFYSAKCVAYETWEDSKSFSVKGTGRFLVELVKKGVKAAKIGIKWLFKKAHEGLTWLEDKSLKQLDKLGKYAEKKILERTEPEPEEIIE